MIDKKMSFLEQMRLTEDKAAKAITSLNRLMSNVVEPKSSKRRLLINVVQPVLLYGAELWADELYNKVFWMCLSQVQHREGN